MKFYRSSDKNATQQWVGSQDAANKAFGRHHWQTVEVPTDKEGLLGFLNRITAEEAEPFPHDAPAETDHIATAPKVETAKGTAQATVASATIDPDTIAHWIMDEATPTQVEATFTALGVRFHEMNRATQHERNHIALSAQKP